MIIQDDAEKIYEEMFNKLRSLSLREGTCWRFTLPTQQSPATVFAATHLDRNYQIINMNKNGVIFIDQNPHIYVPDFHMDTTEVSLK